MVVVVAEALGWLAGFVVAGWLTLPSCELAPFEKLAELGDAEPVPGRLLLFFSRGDFGLFDEEPADWPLAIRVKGVVSVTEGGGEACSCFNSSISFDMLTMASRKG